MKYFNNESILKGSKFIIKNGNKDFFLKMKKSNSRIKNEIKVYKILDISDFSYLEHPKLVFNGNCFFIMTKINQAEYNSDSCKIFMATKEFVFSTYYSKNYNGYFLIHKDLKLGKNNFYTVNQKLAFFDFELTKMSKKLFLLDIVDLAIDPENHKLNFELVREYISLIDEFQIRRISISKQIRFLLLRYHLHQFRHININKKTDIKILLDILFQKDFDLINL